MKKRVVRVFMAGLLATMGLTACTGGTKTDVNASSVASTEVTTEESSVAVTETESLSAEEIAEKFPTETKIVQLLEDKCMNIFGIGTVYSYVGDFTYNDKVVPVTVTYDNIESVASMVWKDDSGEEGNADAVECKAFGINNKILMYKDGVLETDEEKVNFPEINELLDSAFKDMITACQWKMDGYDAYEFALEDTDEGATIIKTAPNLEVTIKLDKENYPVEVIAKIQERVYKANNFKTETESTIEYPDEVKVEIEEFQKLLAEQRAAQAQTATPGSAEAVEATGEAETSTESEATETEVAPEVEETETEVTAITAS